jgi:malate dehydrogenase
MKVTVVGAGHVGASTAQCIAESGLADVVCIDILDGVAKGKMLDLMQSAPLAGHSQRLVGTGDYADCAGSQVAVVTAGVPRKPGMSRDDLLKVNAKIVTEVVEQLKRAAPDAMLLMVTNPLDVTTHIARKVSGLPKNRVFGMAGVLDSTRFRCFIGMELGVSAQEVSAMVLGGHGDTMVPLPRFATVSGIPISALMSQERIDAIVERTAQAGGEIVKLLGTGSAYYAPAAACAQMVSSILRDEKRILPVSVYLEGEYGLSDVYLGVPVVLGRDGVERIVEVPLNDEERAALEASAGHVRKVITEYEELAKTW